MTQIHSETETAASDPTAEHVLAALREVIDPELGVNIVDLGLIVGTDIHERHVTVTMTLTTPGCPLHGTLTREAEVRVARVADVRSVHVELVWDPPWNPDRMSDAAKAELGFL